MSVLRSYYEAISLLIILSSLPPYDTCSPHSFYFFHPNVKKTSSKRWREERERERVVKIVLVPTCRASGPASKQRSIGYGGSSNNNIIDITKRLLQYQPSTSLSSSLPREAAHLNVIDIGYLRSHNRRWNQH